MKNILFLFTGLFLFSCTQKQIQISNSSSTKVGRLAANELAGHLSKIFSGVQFYVTENDSNADIQLVISNQLDAEGNFGLPLGRESFKILEKDQKLSIISSDERGLLNACYALLEKQGCGFYISGDVYPQPKKWKGFKNWEMEDRPLSAERFLFNWHNFLSGCTGWNLEDWQKWIDQVSKMRYNGIMVHAYGNNPMFSFEYLGEKKQTGYLNNTASGRDWGNQHVNDVRRMTGGELFDDAVFGSRASMVAEDEKENAATELMQQVFTYAESKGTKVIFALDFDTWMANPKNIIEKLPKESVFELINGHLTPNPDSPEGYIYFKQVLKSLLEMYPQIDQLSVWHRRPGTSAGLGSIWMSFPYEKFPENWKMEYQQKLLENPEVEDNLMATGTFAYGKLIAALQRARDEIKPELEISSGSWRFDYIPYADAMYPKNVPLLPLDWEVVFDTDEAQQILAKAGSNREMYPILWAHHDDHRYIGRPYTPWENLSDKLKNVHAKGFGIIHWTTHPLDLYFLGSARQVWETTENESVRQTVDNFVTNRFGNNPELSEYFYNWLTEGPMFGRETSDHFVDLGKQKLGYNLENWKQMEQKTTERLNFLENIPGLEENEYINYQKAMEGFYLSFFQNQQLFDSAFHLAANQEFAEAQQFLQRSKPDAAIQKFVDATKIVGFSSGEKAMVFSMNTRWKADFLNLGQRIGLEEVRYKFAPTQHDPLAQGPGHFTYFIDENKRWYRCLWKNELGQADFIQNKDGTFLRIHKNFEFPLKSMHGQALAGAYSVEIRFRTDAKDAVLKLDSESEKAISEAGAAISCKNDILKIAVKDGHSMYVSEIVITPKPE